jgi:purine-binding chemotaxis protein CheW
MHPPDPIFGPRPARAETSYSDTAARAATARAAVLAERARRIAQAVPDQEPGDRLEFLVFGLGSETYAVEISFVREVHPLKTLTPVPCTPDFIRGIISVRGQFCPVVDLKRLIGLPEQKLTNATRVVVLLGTAMEFGILADTIIGVRMINLSDILPPPATQSEAVFRFVRGLTQDRVIIFDAAAILLHPGLIVNEGVDD